MPQLERRSVVKRGARFFEHDDKIMFEFVMDAGSRIGPRPATEEDIRQHPEAYAAMGDAPEVNPPVAAFTDIGAPRPSTARPFAEKRQRALRQAQDEAP